jgi:hypothetical protein
MYRQRLLLYSINSWLSYKIAEAYFQDVHYVWCSPFFNATRINPPSSNPIDIYNNLRSDVDGKDRHSSKIEQIRAGIIKGANIKKNHGIITEEQEQEIIEIVNAAEIEDFRPLIYIIPTEKVEKIVKQVSVKYKADKFSQEYIIEELHKNMFDIIDFEGRI